MSDTASLQAVRDLLEARHRGQEGDDGLSAVFPELKHLFPEGAVRVYLLRRDPSGSWTAPAMGREDEIQVLQDLTVQGLIRRMETKDSGESDPSSRVVRVGAWYGCSIPGTGNFRDCIVVHDSSADRRQEHAVSIELRLEVSSRILSLANCPGQHPTHPTGSPRHAPEMVGSSSAIKQVKETAMRAAGSDSPILITGESGTGKEILARLIHQNSSRSSGPMVQVNMAALSPGVLESELFGHVKGAFTDAHQDRQGVFEQASGGTLFLDEIGEMPLALQGRLLQVIQGGGFRKVGDTDVTANQVRIIAATHRSLPEMIQKNLFRKDLYYRLNVIPLEIPPLRSHPGDIPELCSYFIKKFGDENNHKIQLSRKAEKLLAAYPWPGNIRELENLIHRITILSTKEWVGPQDLMLELSIEKENEKNYQGKGLKEAVNLFKKRFIEHNLSVNQGNQTRTAEILGIQRTYLSRLIRELDINNKGEGNHVSG